MEKTLALIKPDAVKAGFSDAIIGHIEKNDFTILDQKQVRLSKTEVQGFYGAEHGERPYFEELVNFMTSGDVIIMVLERDNAITGWRDLMGATDPAEAAEGTIRKLFGTSKGNNATHGSDATESATREIEYFFPSK
ncbi:MAG: nucleoside-diphosphate kinase [Alteromonas naphthalenivorans]|jgi:nucleoside-diphosphate kinase